MNLKSLINIYFTSKQTDNFEIYFKNEQELEIEVNKILNSFIQIRCDEELANPSVITKWLLNNLEVKTYTPKELDPYKNKKAELEKLKIEDPEKYAMIYNELVKYNKRERDKKGLKFIKINREQMYLALSKEQMREYNLNKIIK
jgi:hypothetical protein